MWFLTRFVGVILIFNAILLSGVFIYRTLTPTYLDDVLAIDEQCGFDCWFGFQADGQTQRRRIETAVNAAGATTISTRGTNIRFTHFHDDNTRPIGTISVELQDGFAINTCFFPTPTSVTIADLYATFGPPDSFWLYEFQSRAAFQVLYTYESGQILARGDVNFDWSSTDLNVRRLGIDSTIRQICTAADLDLGDIQPLKRPDWHGFYRPLAIYEADVYVFSDDDPFSIQ